MLAVTGLGMVSALGFDAGSCCAAARAGISRITEVDDLYVEDLEGDETAPVAVHRAHGITTGLFGFARLLQLGQLGLEDLLSSVDLPDDGRTGMILTVSNGGYREAWFRRVRDDGATEDGEDDIDGDIARFDAVKARIANELLTALVRRLELPIGPSRMTLPSSASGFVRALHQAEEWLSLGRCERCIVGGIDSLVEASTLAALDALGLLRTPRRSVGMIPGEAACFILLERARSTGADRARALALLESTASADDAPHPRLERRTPNGGGVTEAVTRALQGAPEGGRDTALTVVNLNGDPYRASRWWQGLLRTSVASALKDLPVWLPPLHFGDIGAATGQVAIAMLARGWARGYSPRHAALVCLMDDEGGCGAIRVRMPTETS